MKFLEIFNGFKSLKILKADFPRLWMAFTAKRFSLKPHFMLTLREMWENCLGTNTWRVNSPKITSLWTLPPHRPQLRITWNFGQNLRQDYVYLPSLGLPNGLFYLYLFNTRLDKIRSEVIRKELEISGIQDVRLKYSYKQNWINHLERMDNTRLPKHALNYKPRGRRDRGRPRKRWQCVDAGTGQTT